MCIRDRSNTSKPIYTKIFHLIYYWCITNNIVPPNRNDTIIKKNGKVYRTCLLYTSALNIDASFTNNETNEVWTL